MTGKKPTSVPGPTAPRRVKPRWLLSAALGALWPGLSGPARADSLVARGEPAPDFALPALSGPTVRLDELRGRPALLLFGELYNPNSLAACRDVAALLARPGMAELQVAAYLIVAQDAPAAELRAAAKRRQVGLAILHDQRRQAFAAYRVIVLPSLVVVDRAGKVALACAGYPLRFADMVADALLYAGGSLSAAEYGRRRSAALPPPAGSNALRARRLAGLARQLARRGSSELAISQFRAALKLDPDSIAALVGLGELMLARRDLPAAEKLFRRALTSQPDSFEAGLGLVQVELTRGGPELTDAQDRLAALLQKRPDSPKVIYLAGLVAERSGDAAGAAAHYKRAAELLLYGHEQRWELK